MFQILYFFNYKIAAEIHIITKRQIKNFISFEIFYLIKYKM